MYTATIAVLGSRPIVREGLEGLLRTVGSFEVAPGYGSLKELYAREDLLDAVVIDLDRSLLDELLHAGTGPVPVPHAIAVFGSPDE